MKSRIASFCFVAIAMAAISSAYGQAAGPAGGAPPVVVAHLKSNKGPLVVEREVLAKLDLTAPQRDQVKTAILALGDSLKDLRKLAKGDPKSEEVKEKRKAIRKTYLDALKGILTPDQFKQYRQLHQELAKKAAALKPAETPIPPKPAQQG